MSYPELEHDYQRLPENSRNGVSSTEAKNMYQKISASDLPMVFGNHAFQPGSRAIGIDHEMVRNFGTAAPSIKTVTDRVGGVLHEILPSGTILGSRQTGRGPSEKWSIAANDTWIIAGKLQGNQTPKLPFIGTIAEVKLPVLKDVADARAQ